MKKVLLFLISFLVVNSYAYEIQSTNSKYSSDDEKPEAWITGTRSGENNGQPGVFVSYGVQGKSWYDVTVKICVVGNEAREFLNLEPCITETCEMRSSGSTRYKGSGTVFFPCNGEGLSMELSRCGMSDFSIVVTNY